MCDALNVAVSQGCKVSAELVEYDLTGELEKIQNSAIVFSPYVTFWVEGNYYILAKQENIDDPEHLLMVSGFSTEDFLQKC